MEFFATVAEAWTEDRLVDALTIGNLPARCASITEVVNLISDDEGILYTVWGEFRVLRSRIRGGLRFWMPHCPNAAAWTITTGLPPDPTATVVHCTINRQDHDADFIDSLHDFVDDWRAGLTVG